MNNAKDEPSTPLQLDELILDRLVDNDLGDDEYRQVLRLVEEKPDGWRQLAMAFLESQAFEKELSALHQFPADEAESAVFVDNPLAGNPSKKENAAYSSASATNSIDPVQRSSQHSFFWQRLRKTVPALAACVAIAITAGLYIREIQDRARTQAVDQHAGINRAGNGALDPGFIELVSNDPDGGVQTPVYSHQKFDPGIYAQEIDSLKPKLQEVVNQSGLNADERTHVVPIKDKTGNRIIVPMKEIKLTPNSFEDYQ